MDECVITKYKSIDHCEVKTKIILCPKKTQKINIHYIILCGNNCVYVYKSQYQVVLKGEQWVLLLQKVKHGNPDLRKKFAH